ncbi:ribosome assembly RNA-binding protein YhbY [Anaerococcus sp. Marseille-P3625]|uniref:ribosome assembly RNA-binding protein YhbY n=1 Tax=Anaerococcus sp. Marseille-P3625 TaxID=1977277 RepID=UPI000C07546A|nr:ribosome assembly RNA-binding protein YhbY [Anaerococcus sp. Marseille-P3625]
MINAKERAKLKSLSHDYKPVINIGKNSITDEVIRAIDEALSSRELIKIKILNNNLDDQDEILENILNSLNADFVNHLGSIITIYRKSDDNKFEL